MTKVEEAKAALWGQLVDSGELEGDDAEILLDNLVDAARAEGAEGIMSCPLYTHGWANDDDRRGEVHCCDRKGYEMSWNPAEMNDELKRAGIDPASVLAPKEPPCSA